MEHVDGEAATKEAGLASDSASIGPRQPPTIPPAQELPRGATIGRYTIIRRIGAGGMGIVYLAFDPELDRRVAVKLLRAHANEPSSEGPARLLREAQVMAKLSHPNVVAVFDVGTYENDVFVAMEYVKGSTLREWWTVQKRSADETLAICIQAGRGLAAAHAQGILHRDLKPENILVDEHGRARVADFGLARAASDTTSTGQIELDDTLVGRRSSVSLPETQVGAVVGTPAYMAPEQLRAMPIDARSDQFSFAVTVFEALHGARPYTGATVMAILQAIKNARPAAPAKGSLPREIGPAIQRGLAYEPKDRFATMDELLAALERGRARGGKHTTLLLGVLGVVLILGAVVLAWLRPARAPTCSGMDQGLAGAWDAKARTEVAAAFRATRNADVDAEEIFDRVSRALDAYAASWVTMSTEACIATRVRGVQSDEALDLRTACLQRRAESLSALTELLRHADGTLVDNAQGAVARLPPVAACADLHALRSAYAPVSEDKKAAVESLRHDVASVVALYDTGHCDDAVPIVTEVAKRARTTGYAPVAAEAFYWAGRTWQTCRDAQTSSDYLFESVADAEESHQDELAARALILLSEVQGSGLSHYEEGKSLARLAEAAVKRVGSPDALLAELARARGWNEYTRGNLEAALPLRREALARHRKAVGDSDPDAIDMRSALCDLEYEAGDLGQALADQQDLLARSVAMLGPKHQRVGRYTLDIAETLGAQGKYEESVPWLERAKPMLGSAAREHAMFVEAVMHFGLGQVERGASELRAIIAIAEHDNGVDDPYPLSTRGDLAKWLSVHRRPTADAVLALVKHIAAGKDPENPWYANAYAAYAIEATRLGRADEAATGAAAHAVALAEHGQAQLPYALLAQGEVALARGDAAAAVGPLDRARKMVDARGGIDAIILGDIDSALAKAVTASDPAWSKALTADAAKAYAASKEPSLVATLSAPSSLPASTRR